MICQSSWICLRYMIVLFSPGVFIPISVMANEQTESRADLIDRLIKRKEYNRLVRPDEESNKPTAITIDVMVNMISSISEINMEFTTDIYYRQRWLDTRLAFGDFNGSLNLGYSRIESIWYPDIYFPNLKGGYRHELTSPNILLRLYPDGTVLYSQRLALIVACSMELQKFPLDEQKCRLDFMSYGHTVEELTVSWDGERNISLNANIKLPDFELDGYKLGDCTEVFSTGTYGCVFVELKFTRQFGYYLTGTYLPTMLIIILSWVGFWIDYKSTPSRISLGLLTVLAVTTQSTGIQAGLPRVSYVKSIDVWMAICMVFVAGALLEFAIVNVIARKDSAKNLTTRSIVHNSNEENGRLSTASTQELVYSDKCDQRPVFCRKSRDSVNENHKDCSENTACLKVDQSCALRIDKLSRILFPVLFCLTTIIYGLSVHLNAYPKD